MKTIITFPLELTPDWDAVNKAIGCTPKAKIYPVETGLMLSEAIVIAPTGLTPAQAQKVYDEAFDEELK